jgi:hypothetical protein
MMMTSSNWVSPYNLADIFRPLLRAAARLMDLAERDAGMSAWYFHGVIIEQAIAIDVFTQNENPKLAHFLELHWSQFGVSIGH